MTKAQTAQGMRVGVFLNDSDTVPKYFNEVSAIPEVGDSPDKIDCTSLECDTHVFIKDIPTYADLSFTMYAQPFIEGTVSDVSTSNLNLIRSMDKNKSYHWVIEYPLHNLRATFVGDWSWSMGAGAVSSAVELTLTIIPRSSISWDPYGSTNITISFDANGGTGTMAAVTQTFGTTLSSPACTFTPPTDKIFSRWDTKPDGTGVGYDTGDTITLIANTTLYAIWVTDNSS
jgi:hypothetical protein